MEDAHKVIEYAINDSVLSDVVDIIYKHIRLYKKDVTDEAALEKILKEMHEDIDKQNMENIITPLNLNEEDAAVNQENCKVVADILKKFMKKRQVTKEKLKEFISKQKIINTSSSSEKQQLMKGLENMICQDIISTVRLTLVNRPGCYYKSPSEISDDTIRSWKKAEKYCYLAMALVVIGFLIWCSWSSQGGTKASENV